MATAGRDAPVAAFGPLLRTPELDSLGPSDGVKLLCWLGVPPVRVVPINRALRGHPRSLRLGASRAGDVVELRVATDELARVYIAELETRRVASWPPPASSGA